MLLIKLFVERSIENLFKLIVSVNRLDVIFKRVPWMRPTIPSDDRTSHSCQRSQPENFIFFSYHN